ncbi:MAG TPA: cupin domain-containing protein [Vicinamibacterales bacterium]|jgi:mannose-6-phosphate isomerase-like protein (cupin superfamily)
MSPDRKVSTLSAALAIVAAAPLLVGQSRTGAPVVGITHGEIDAVLEYSGTEGAGTDRQIRVADAGGYQIGVGVLHRGPTRAGAPIAAISHGQVTEVFYILSGSGVLVTGGTVDNERPFPPETEFVRLAVGPSTGGTFKGGDRRKVEPGDVVVVPAGVPHGFDDIADHLDYLSVRPDTAKTLPAGYVHPALRR